MEKDGVQGIEVRGIGSAYQLAAALYRFERG